MYVTLFYCHSGGAVAKPHLTAALPSIKFPLVPPKVPPSVWQVSVSGATCLGSARQGKGFIFAVCVSNAWPASEHENHSHLLCGLHGYGVYFYVT